MNNLINNLMNNLMNNLINNLINNLKSKTSLRPMRNQKKLKILGIRKKMTHKMNMVLIMIIRSYNKIYQAINQIDLQHLPRNRTKFFFTIFLRIRTLSPPQAPIFDIFQYIESKSSQIHFLRILWILMKTCRFHWRTLNTKEMIPVF